MTLSSDLQKAQKIHFTGIKGIAMSAFACLVAQKDIEISGSDIDEAFPSDQILKNVNVRPNIGFSREFIRKTKPDLLIYTGAHNGRENEEVVQAVSMGIPVMPHGKALGLIMKDFKAISVAGSHGKTTCSAMIASVLRKSKLDPSYAVGCGEIFPIGNPGYLGSGKWFIAEADEYVTDPGHDSKPRFLWQNPTIGIVLNIEFDHPDVYGSIDDVFDAFRQFVSNVTPNGTLIVNGDSKKCRKLVSKNTVTVGFGASNIYQIKNYYQIGKQQSFDLYSKNSKIGTFKICLPGIHNIFNSAVSLVAANLAGIGWQEAGNSLSSFKGTKRRIEEILSDEFITIYDDYAHHPSEIKATLKAIRSWYPKRKIITVFQPHTYTRTKNLLDSFSKSFAGSDQVIITDIYASGREADTGMVSAGSLAKLTSKHQNHVFYKGKFEEVSRYLLKNIHKSDIIVFMGAGDIYNWASTFTTIYNETKNK
ncbi:UDP-N-acetylmuramate--L-alanine ligase [Patescibacteria group bacterium]